MMKTNFSQSVLRRPCILVVCTFNYLRITLHANAKCWEQHIHYDSRKMPITEASFNTSIYVTVLHDIEKGHTTVNIPFLSGVQKGEGPKERNRFSNMSLGEQLHMSFLSNKKRSWCKCSFSSSILSPHCICDSIIIFFPFVYSTY